MMSVAMAAAPYCCYGKKLSISHVDKYPEGVYYMSVIKADKNNYIKKGRY